jgi:hypothetical protein
MNTMVCYLCGSNNFKPRPGEVRDKIDLKVLVCKLCSLVTLNDFSHI